MAVALEGPPDELIGLEPFLEEVRAGAPRPRAPTTDRSTSTTSLPASPRPGSDR
jgi:hypothetical protein